MFVLPVAACLASVVRQDAHVALSVTSHGDAAALRPPPDSPVVSRKEAQTAEHEVKPVAEGDEVVFGGISRKTLEKVMGPIGGTLAIVMFLSAGPVMIQIVKEGSVGEFSVFPYVVQICNCALWVIYALADKGNPFTGDGKMLWPFTCNAVGVVIAGFAYTLYFFYCNSSERKSVMTFSWPAFAAILGFAVYVFMQTGEGREWTAEKVAGNLCLVVNIVMYMGPLAGLQQALASRSTRYLPLSLGVTTLTCSLPWFLFGLGVSNYTIWFPNACGLVFGVVQISTFMWLTHYASPKDDANFHVSSLAFPLNQNRASHGNLAGLFDQAKEDEAAQRS